MPKIAALGGLSSRGFGEFAQQSAANYIEDVFSTYLYTGNESGGSGTTQTIINNIDLSGKGGMIWGKDRSSSNSNRIQDTVRGVGNEIFTNLTNAQNTGVSGISSFNSNGFTLGGTFNNWNISGDNYVSWTFRKQPKFFDVITYTGDGSTDRAINHSLDSTPAMIFVKCTSEARNWIVYNRNLDGGSASAYQYILLLNSTSGEVFSPMWKRLPTSTEFYVTSEPEVNGNGKSYVAYLFAHNAGGFGADGSQNVISCGSFTTDGSGNATVNLGYEPQWLMVKRTDSAQNWFLVDIMRGMPVDSTQVKQLNPNLSNAESTGLGLTPSSTGFNVGISASATYIYMAIRRGPMRTPTSGTSVFSPILNTGGNGSTKTITGIGFAPDAVFGQARNAGFLYNGIIDRLRGVNKWLSMQLTDAEGSYTNSISQLNNNSWVVGADSTGSYNYSTYNYISWNFGRAPGFFDVACYTGTGVATTQAHNLGVAPELMIFKSRNTAGTNWAVCVPLTPTTYNYLTLQSTNSANNRTYGPGGSPNFEELSAPPTSSVINLASSAELNASGRTFVAYLFATCPGVSKVGSYTGTGATQTISCGFTGGARYVLIKRTDSTGSWYVWDSARGMVAGTDPSLLLNTTAAEVNANSIYTTTGGFQIVSTAADINASGGTYLYLSIA